jgi:hypothetical protein
MHEGLAGKIYMSIARYRSTSTRTYVVLGRNLWRT